MVFKSADDGRTSVGEAIDIDGNEQKKETCQMCYFGFKFSWNKEMLNIYWLDLFHNFILPLLRIPQKCVQ